MDLSERKRSLFLAAALFVSGGAANAAPPLPPPSVPELNPLPPVAIQAGSPTQFMTTVQFAVQELTPGLNQRAQRLVMDQFSDVFESSPEFVGRHYEVKTNGPEVVFYVAGQNDLRQPMEKAVTQLIQSLNGRVRARGRTQFYRTSLEQQNAGTLEVRTDETHKKILSVSAQSVPLRDILKEIKAQVGGLSYLIPGECAEQLVDWSFGEDGGEEPKALDAAMREIGSLFKLNLVKQANTYVFSGGCDAASLPKAQKRPAPGMMQNDLWTDLPKGGPGVRPTAVFFSVPPIAR
jgi:hypothetical protein